MFDDLILDAAKWEDAECASGYDPDLWFDLHQEDKAKAICRKCPLVMMCAEYAIENHEPFGVWGGLSPADRQKLRKWR